MHLAQRQSALSFTDNAISRQFFGYLLGFAINVKAHLSIGRSLLLPLLRIPSHPGIKAIALMDFGHGLPVGVAGWVWVFGSVLVSPRTEASISLNNIPNLPGRSSLLK